MRDELTTQVMLALPHTLRPNPHSIEDAIHKAVSNGWTPKDLALASYTQEKLPNPGLVVHNIRKLAEYPPRQLVSTPTPPKLKPAPPGVPMPPYVREAWEAARKGGGASSSTPQPVHPTGGVS